MVQREARVAIKLASHAWLAVRVCLLLARVELGLRTATLPDLTERLRIGFGNDKAAGPAPAITDWREVTTLLRRVHKVTSLWPFGDTCLRRCLVAGALLADAHPLLVVGINRGATGEINAHAWLVIDGHSVDPMSDAFVPLSVR